jgi:hypothetical protein
MLSLGRNNKSHPESQRENAAVDRCNVEAADELLKDHVRSLLSQYYASITILPLRL